MLTLNSAGTNILAGSFVSAVGESLNELDGREPENEYKRDEFLSKYYRRVSVRVSPTALTGIRTRLHREAARICILVNWNITTMDWNLTTVNWNVPTMDRSFIWEFDILYEHYNRIPLRIRIELALRAFKYIYYPLLAVVGVPVNVVTIVILSRGKCGVSQCVTRYLVAMAAADLLVIILDLILRHIPIVYRRYLYFLFSLPVCNVHAVLVYAATNCSVWFTVTFTFDRFVAICCQKLKTKYCSGKTAAVVLGTVTVMSCLIDIFWYFMLSDAYQQFNNPWFCRIQSRVMISTVWGTIEFLHYILTPCVPFVIIVLLNALTVRHILVSSRARRRLRSPSNVESPRDPEMESRRKSIILLLLISGNFILLWSVYMVHSLWGALRWFDAWQIFLPSYVREFGFMLQLLSCCTNTVIYCVTQTKFREQLKNVGKYPLTLFVKFIKR
uniref:probable G-protein coupled receptor 139 n=1 Tax=Pristiophorus japonicus TaxID=55135 RepID=UPI00398E876C